MNLLAGVVTSQPDREIPVFPMFTRQILLVLSTLKSVFRWFVLASEGGDQNHKKLHKMPNPLLYRLSRSGDYKPGKC